MKSVVSGQELTGEQSHGCPAGRGGERGNKCMAAFEKINYLLAMHSHTG